MSPELRRVALKLAELVSTPWTLDKHGKLCSLGPVYQLYLWQLSGNPAQPSWTGINLVIEAEQHYRKAFAVKAALKLHEIDRYLVQYNFGEHLYQVFTEVPAGSGGNVNIQGGSGTGTGTGGNVTLRGGAALGRKLFNATVAELKWFAWKLARA